MKWIVVAMMSAVLMAGPALAGDLTVEDFNVMTTEDLLDLCTVSPDNPLYAKAIHFCHGYLVGAYHYYAASTSGPNAQQLVCLPENRPSRNEAIEMFVEWAKERPQYAKDLPVETQFRFLTEKWPCDR